jgi:DNA polymerase III alpha subunit/nucleotidyltransferase/DNA polymerase involved in DNA repair
MFSYAYDFTPDVEITSIDEGYFDLSAVRRDPAEVARLIRDAIRQALKITVSEGLGANKLVSQIASKLHKPAAFCQVPCGEELPFLHPLPNRWLPGVGPKTAMRLNAAGLARIGQIAVTPVDLLELLVGSAAPVLRRFANGIDERPIIPVSAPAKSYGEQETFAQDQTDETFLEAILRRMADNLMAKVRADGKTVRTVTVKVRYNDMAEDQCSESLAEPTDLETDLYGRLPGMLRQAWKRRVSLRLIALKLSNLYEGWRRLDLPLDRAAEQVDARRRLAKVIDELRAVRGRYVILRGHDLALREVVVSESGSRKVEGGRREADGRRRRSEIGDWRFEIRDLKSEIRARRLEIRDRRAVIRASLPLQVRSYYSFLNSTLSPAAIVAWAAQHDMPAIGLCDEGNLHGAAEFVQAADAAGVQPILGAEVRVAGQPLWLYVEDATGYRNLCRLLSQKAEGGKRKAAGGGNTDHIPAFHLSPSALEPTEGLLAVALDDRWAECFPGRFYLGIVDLDDWRRRLASDRFPGVAMGPVHYATPADRWKFDIVQSIRTLTLLRQAHPAKLGDGPWHFPSPAEQAERFQNHPACLERAREIAERCRGFKFPFGPPQFPAYRPPNGSAPREFLRQLVFAGARERYAPSQRSAIQTQLEAELGIIHEVGYEEYFLVVWDILQECRRRGIDWITRGSAADSLVCYCLGISSVCPLRFELYFRRFLNKERMALHKLPDIDVDFPHDRKDDVVDLLFEKYGPTHCAVVGGFSTFQARSAFAEVAKVLGVAERDVRRFTEHFPWGFSGVAPLIPDQTAGGSQAAGTGASRAAADGRSQGGLAALLQASPECRDLPLEEEPYRSALAMAEFLDGFPRYPKMHPCGVVLSHQPMVELTPTFRSQKGYPTTHFDMDAVEAIGLVKIDILAQGGLAVMRDARALLAEQGIDVDLEQCTAQEMEGGGQTAEAAALTDDSALHALHEPAVWCPPFRVPANQPAEAGTPNRQDRSMGHEQVREEGRTFDDPAVWEMIASGGARAVHHIESPAMTSLCRQCNVREIDGLIAIVSVIRPGAANEQKKAKFTRRYQGLESPEYPDPSLEACLRSTFGLVVYEEHILQICEAFAGLAPGRADVLRRALVKQHWQVVQQIGHEFAAAARARGHRDDRIREVWALVTGFNGYAFCKAHSTAYGVEAYQSAWLKRYFPAEFMAAVLTNGKGFYAPLVYVLECHRLGISFLAPWVNEPGPHYAVKVDDGRQKAAARGTDGSSAGHLAPSTCHSSIRVPVTRVKGLTERTSERLFQERRRGEFASLRDFYLRVKPSAEEMEALIRVGAFDGFEQTRTAQFWEYCRVRAAFGHTADPDQGWLFPPVKAENARQETEIGGALDRATGPLPPVAREEPTRLQRLQWETELLGFAVSAHPLALYRDVAWATYCPVAQLGEHVGEEVVTCGLIIEERVHHQVTGEPMKFLTLCDWTGMVETELFAATYKTCGLATVRYPVLELTARVEPFENGRGFSLRALRAGKPRTRLDSRPLVQAPKSGRAG